MIQSQIAYLLEQLNNSEPEPQQLVEEEVQDDFHPELNMTCLSHPSTQFSHELGVAENTMEDDNEDEKIREAWLYF